MTGSARARAAVVDAEQLLSYVVNSTDEAIITVTRDGTITSWNRGAERLYGYRAIEAVGQHIAIIDPSTGAIQEQKLLRKVFAGSAVERFDTEKLDQNGDRIVVSQAMAPVRDAKGRVISAAILTKDVSERRYYEERLRYLADFDQL